MLKCGHCGGSLSITYTRKKDRRYTYYYCVKDNNRAASECPVIRIPAGDTDKIILRQLEAVFRTPSMLAQIYFEAEKAASEEKTFMLARKVIIAPEAVDGEVPDAESPVKAPLAQAIARAHAWLRLIETGKVANMAQLAEKLELDHAYVSRIFRLVNIAPDIIEAILNGTENAIALSLQNLRAPIPVDWKKQRRLLGAER